MQFLLTLCVCVCDMSYFFNIFFVPDNFEEVCKPLFQIHYFAMDFLECLFNEDFSSLKFFLEYLPPKSAQQSPQHPSLSRVPPSPRNDFLLPPPAHCAALAFC